MLLITLKEFHIFLLQFPKKQQQVKEQELNMFLMLLQLLLLQMNPHHEAQVWQLHEGASRLMCQDEEAYVGHIPACLTKASAVWCA